MLARARAVHPVLTVDVNEDNAGAGGFVGVGRPYPLLHLRG
ncbi:hypothetical protein ACFOMD_06015 [Sphingoaurantiacus capsulatus]|uniref:Uncharacterized protein n=1 Tax=Sphingoaurantiacus capsulatus TaxID=1771310 RepID=A0ABV7X7I9_9SPHN